ncbi:hypothetical protein [Kribbella sp. C-35]|uniref:hypothetical protein n=1 Tax=Kribbella sp. C-35 TaxID=2789276 RepID=UPI003978793F
MTGTTGRSVVVVVVVPVVGLRLVVVELPDLVEPLVFTEPVDPVGSPVLGSLLAAVEAPASRE